MQLQTVLPHQPAFPLDCCLSTWLVEDLTVPSPEEPASVQQLVGGGGAALFPPIFLLGPFLEQGGWLLGVEGLQSNSLFPAPSPAPPTGSPIVGRIGQFLSQPTGAVQDGDGQVATPGWVATQVGLFSQESRPPSLPR